ncbi:MAG TPA: hypothetical protein PLU44_15915 [Candidatus Krumholzibacteria bacterium]|nr:hypothetical protein [Candidatus Krumholzibacteria bacterium]
MAKRPSLIPKAIRGENGECETVVLTTPSSLLEKVGLGAAPGDFGLPDLLRDGLTAVEQNQLLKTTVETHLYISKDGRRLPIVMIPPMVEFVGDLFFERVQQAILWKPRGGGGSLAAAILIWLMMVYRQKSFLDMAGSGEQAKRVYEYVSQFWFCVEGLAETLLEGDPLQSETRLKSGVTLSCVPASEKAARGKHVAGFVADESCQEDLRVGKILHAAVQGALSEPNFTIVLLSTFHVPFGFFQENWDLAEERGFHRYRWDVYDCMAPCRVGMEDASEDDPQALRYCQHECPLTEVVPDRDGEGLVIGEHFEGCNGRARAAAGHLSRDNVLKAKLLNSGTDVWAVEHECKRPTASGMVYDAEKVQAAVFPLSDLERPEGAVRRAVGIDWGRFAVAVMAERGTDHVLIPEGRIFDSKTIGDLVQYLVELRSRIGDFTVYADSENAYGNLDCRNAGFEVVPVAFNKMKDGGIENLARYFNHQKIRIADSGHLKTVVRQLLRYRRNEDGRIVKKDDHGPDALLCAMLHFPFIDEFDTALGQMLSGTDRERLKVTSSLLDSCIRDYPLEVPKGRTCSMGVSMGSSGFYVVVSLVPDYDYRRTDEPRQALFIGKVKDWPDLDQLIEQYNVRACLIAPQPEPHLVQKWVASFRDGIAQVVIYTNDGMSEPAWDRESRRVTVDRTYALNSAFEEIKSQLWWIPASARHVDNGDFYAQMKAPTRVRDMTDGSLRYRWQETGPLEHYRHAQAYDHVAAEIARKNPPACCVGMDAGPLESMLLGDYGRLGGED